MTTPSTTNLHLFYLPGTSESYRGDTRTWAQVGSSMGHQLMQQAVDNRVTPHWVGYDATIGPIGNSGANGQSHRDSRAIGKQALDTALKALPAGDKALVTGYSQGAGVVWEYVQEMYAGQHAEVRDKIHAAIYVANPFKSQVIGSYPHTGSDALKGWGVANRFGSVHEWADRTEAEAMAIPEVEIVNEKDVICNADPDSFVRGIADLVEFFEFEDLIGWATKTAAEAGKFDWSTEIQSWRDLPRLVRRITRSVDDINGYMTGQHTRAYWDSAFRTINTPNGPKTLLAANEEYIASVIFYAIGNHPDRPDRFS